MSAILGTGIAFPLGVDDRGRLALAHGAEDVEQAIALILATAPGERRMRPEFGCAVHDYVFERVDAYTTGRMEDAIRAALERWEPRITVDDVTFDDAGYGVLQITIVYRLKGTSDARNLVYPFYVVPEEEDQP